MSKKDGTTAAAAAAASKAKKNMKGIPRVTDKILAMDEAGRQAWLDGHAKTLSPEVIAEIKTRMDKAIKDGREPKKVNFSTIFNGRSVAELTEAQTALTAALASAAVAEEDNLNRIIAKAQAQKEALVNARKAQAATETAATA